MPGYTRLEFLITTGTGGNMEVKRVHAVYDDDQRVHVQTVVQNCDHL
jgi:hypothetical protein